MSINRPHWCDRTLIHGPAYYGLCVTERALHATLRKLRIPREQWPPFVGAPAAKATTYIFENPDGELVIVVTIKDWEKKTGIEVAGLLVHESVHIWQAIRRAIGEIEPSKEFEAYALQNISQSLMVAFAEATGARR